MMTAWLLAAAVWGQTGDFATIVSDAGGGGYEAFPDICRLADGRLLCVFYDSYAHVGLPTSEQPHGGRISCVVSADDGVTWSEPTVVYDGPNDDRDPSVLALPDGRVVCNFFILKPAGEDRQYEGLGSWMVTSTDMGKTWGEAAQIADGVYCSSPIRVHSSGRWILGLYREGPSGATGCVVTSDDEGKTWNPVVDIPNAGRKLDAETDVIELETGALLAVQRAQQGDMAWSVSVTRGDKWSLSQEIGFPGHCPYLHRVDGTILLAFRLPKTSLRYSRDEGQSWSENIMVDDKIGAYPSMVTKKDGTVLIVYYEEGAGSNIRARRFRVTDAGIEWLPIAD